MSKGGTINSEIKRNDFYPVMRQPFTGIRLFLVFMNPIRNMSITASQMLTSGAVIDGFECHNVRIP
jgi:hypothetical protein